VGFAPAVVAGPAGQTVRLGGSASFAVATTGTQPLSYQWRMDGTNLPGATDSLLLVMNVQLRDVGTYSVVVSNTYGVVTSSNAMLTIALPASIVQQPTNVAAAVGGQALLRVVVAGTAPLSYQWSMGGKDLAGATSSVLVLTNVQLSDAGSYAVEVSNAFGSQRSSNAVLSVGFAPVVVAGPVSQTVEPGRTATFAVTATGTAPLGYQWIMDGTNVVAATNTVLVVTNVQLSSAGNYAVEVSNAYGMVTSSNAVLRLGLPAAIVGQPANVAVAVGGTAILQVVAEGTPPLSYQWTLEATNLAWATNSVLILTNVQLSDAGSYAVVVSNAYGSGQSSNAVVSVGFAPVIEVRPVDQTVRLGATATFSVTASGTEPLEYQWNVGGTNVGGATNNVLVVTNVQASDGGSYAVVITNAYGAVASSNAVLTVGLPAVIMAQPTNVAAAVGGTVVLGVVAAGTPPLSYQWSLEGTNLAWATNYTLVLTNVLLNDAGSYAVEVSNAFGSQQSSNAVVSVGLAPMIEFGPTDQTVRLGGSATFTVTAAGAEPLNYQWSLGGTNLAGATNNLLVVTNVQPSDAGTYAVGVSNAYGMVVSSNAVLTLGLPAVIVAQPTNVAVAVGGAAVLGVQAQGTEPLSYQWSLEGTNLVGATNSLLVLTNVQPTDAGSYAVEVSNAYGSEQSSNAVVSVGLAPVIELGPVTQTVRQGSTVTFTVTATGTEPLGYQWSVAGTNLLRATNSALVLTNVQLSAAGSYAVVVSNAFGAASSSNATLSVYAVDHFTWDPIPSPSFVSQPFSVRIQARDATNGLINAFTGSVSLRSTAGVTVSPAISGDFNQGAWAGSMTILQKATNVVLVAIDELGELGYSGPIDVVGVPPLSIGFSGNSVLITWPGDVPAFVLESTSDFSSWTQVTTPIGLNGDHYEVRLRPGSTNSFYRLRFLAPTLGH